MTPQPAQPSLPVTDADSVANSLAEVKSGARRVFLSNWTVFLIRAATTVLVIRTAGAESKGIQAYTVAWAAIFSIVLGLGFSTAIPFWVNSSLLPVRFLQRRIFSQAVLVTAFLVVAHPWIIKLLPPIESGSLPARAINLWTLAMTPLLLMNEQMTSLALATGRLRNYSIQVNGEAIVFGASVLLFIAADNLNATTVLVSTFIGYGIATVIGWIGLHVIKQERDSCTALDASTMYRFALKGYSASLINGVQKRLDLLIIGPLLGAAQLAYYAVGAQGFQALMSLPRALTGLLTRSVSKADEATAAQAITFLVTKKTIGYMSLVAFVVSIVGFWAIPVVYGPSFAAAVPPFIVLVWASVFAGATVCIQTLCFGRGKAGAASINVGVTAGLKLLLLFAFVARFGILGCALATLFSAVFGLVFQVKQARALTAVSNLDR